LVSLNTSVRDESGGHHFEQRSPSWPFAASPPPGTSLHFGHHTNTRLVDHGTGQNGFECQRCLTYKPATAAKEIIYTAGVVPIYHAARRWRVLRLSFQSWKWNWTICAGRRAT
jgi:hypothetical protein